MNASGLTALHRRALLATVILCGLGSALPALAQVKSLEILVPAGPGGGWDQTARAMQNVPQEDIEVRGSRDRPAT